MRQARKRGRGGEGIFIDSFRLFNFSPAAAEESESESLEPRACSRSSTMRIVWVSKRKIKLFASSEQEEEEEKEEKGKKTNGDRRAGNPRKPVSKNDPEKKCEEEICVKV